MLVGFRPEVEFQGAALGKAGMGEMELREGLAVEGGPLNVDIFRGLVAADDLEFLPG